MGSVCCVAARSKDLARSSDGWSLEQSRPYWRNHGALSPPLSSRWEHKWQSSESVSAQNSLHLRRASFSSGRSDSRAGSSDTFAHPHESLDGVCFGYNSPDSCHFSQRFLGNRGDTMTMRPDQVLRLSPASSQEGSGLSTFSASFELASQKMLEDVSQGTNKRQHQGGSGCVSKKDFLSRQRSDASISYATGGSKVVPMEMGVLRKRTKSSMDNLPGVTRDKADSWTAQAFSELVESSRLESARWPTVDSSEYLACAMHEESGMFCTRSPQASHTGGPHGEGQKCGLCGKSIFQKIVGSIDVPVVGVLGCGHAYHAECLEQTTPTLQIHDPPCPLCEIWENTPVKMKGERNPQLHSMHDVSTLSPQKLLSSTESPSKKGFLHMPARSGEKSILGRPLQFSFRGKSCRESTSSNTGLKKPGYAARVTPESNTSPSAGGRKGKFFS